MAADPTSRPDLRVYLAVPDAHRERAAWALEALLARARIPNWRLVEGDEDVDLALPADAAQWDFVADREPDAERDPLAFTFWWLARVEEQLAPEDAFDEHGRFRFERSASARAPHAVPVDELAERIATDTGLARAPHADGEPTWRVVATHDIDLPLRWTRVGRRRALRSIRNDLRAGRIFPALRTTLAYVAGLLPGRDPWDNFAAITDLERAEGAESTSYLLVGRHAPEDGDAELHDRGRSWIGSERGAALGDRVGLHGSYTASDTPGRLAAELAELGARTGASHPDHRFHYLRHRPVDAWPLLASSGLRSDASLGFAEQPGFRAGTAHPYRAWGHEAGAPLDLVVIPLVLMDATFDDRYLDLRDRRMRRDICMAVLDVVRRHGGCASVLVHNDRLCARGDDGWTRLYRELLRHVRSQGGRACTAAEAAARYRDRLPDWRLGA
ncbi:MAG: hypothetical protein JWL76_1613 [Thermoleophilia bacterium]|nr:hypothetical protein [Thermoleophilia bacterium]